MGGKLYLSFSNSDESVLVTLRWPPGYVFRVLIQLLLNCYYGCNLRDWPAAMTSYFPKEQAWVEKHGREVLVWWRSEPFGIERNSCPSLMPFVSGHLKFSGKRDQRAPGNPPRSTVTSLLQIQLCWECDSIGEDGRGECCGKVYFCSCFPCHL